MLIVLREKFFIEDVKETKCCVKLMSSESRSESEESEYWKLAIRKTGLIFICMAVAYFLVVISTLMYYFFFSILTQNPQNYPGMMVWQPFWTLAVIIGFLVGLFKAIIDIINETKTDIDQ